MADPDPFREHEEKEVPHDHESESPITIPISAAPWAVPYQPILDGGGGGGSTEEQNTPGGGGSGGIGTVERNDPPTASGGPVIKAQPSRKRSDAPQSVNDSTTVLTPGTTATTTDEGESHGVHEGYPLPTIVISPNSNGNGSGVAGRPTSLHPSFISTTPSDPPPTYGHQDSSPLQHIDPTHPQTPTHTHTHTQPQTPIQPSFSLELARFARANRDVINENLEARLQAAGYLPTDDPSRLTPEEWRVEYGITRLELRRLVDLYTR
jgi:hypothetical protein